MVAAEVGWGGWAIIPVTARGHRDWRRNAVSTEREQRIWNCPFSQRSGREWETMGLEVTGSHACEETLRTRQRTLPSVTGVTGHGRSGRAGTPGPAAAALPSLWLKFPGDSSITNSVQPEILACLRLSHLPSAHFQSNH